MFFKSFFIEAGLHKSGKAGGCFAETKGHQIVLKQLKGVMNAVFLLLLLQQLG